MRVTRLASRDLRNLAGDELDTDARFVVISGPNGQGKTNLIEAVWWLATLRPLRGHRSRDLIRWDADACAVSGSVAGRHGTQRLRVDLGARRSLAIDGESTSDLDAWFGVLRAIAFTPQDGAIVTDEPARRREWVDRAAFTAAPSHLGVVRSWQRVLAHKAALLRRDPVDIAVLDVLDDQLARASAEVALRRERLVDELRPHVDAMHRHLTGGVGALEVRVTTAHPGTDVAARTRAYRDDLRRHRADELRRRTCLVGPHRDDLQLLLDGQPLRTFGSRGQVRTMVLALKLAELLAAHDRGDRPVFLLDDLSSELDQRRTHRLVEVLDGLDAQVWVTTTEPTHLGVLPTPEVRRVEVADGRAVPA